MEEREREGEIEGEGESGGESDIERESERGGGGATWKSAPEASMATTLSPPCIVKSFRSHRSFISSPLWTP